MWWRFQQWFGNFTMLLVKTSSETGLFDIYVTTFFEVVISEIQRLWGSSFFPKCSKSNIDFKNAVKDWENVFCLRVNCIWIGIVKFSLLRRGYFSLAGNVLTSRPKTWDVNNRDFFQLKWPASDQWSEQRCCDGDFNSDSARLPCCLSKGPLKQNFLDIYLTTFLEFVISEIKNLWGWSFVST